MMSCRNTPATIATTRAETTLRVPRHLVWAFLLDVPQSATCLPGVQNVRRIDDRTYAGEVRFRVGPLSFGFETTVVITELVEEERLTLTAHAVDPLTREAIDATAVAVLADAPDSSTRVQYELRVVTPGVLAGLGRRMFEDLNRRMAAEFLARVEERLIAGTARPPSAR